MRDVKDLDRFLAGARIDQAVGDLRPDYRAMLIAIDGLRPGAGGSAAEALLQAAEASVRKALADGPIEATPHVAAWRDAYRAFGAKPQRTRNSLEALMRRAEDGLPRVNPLTDLYNAVSVLHQIPLGGEDLAGYVGPPRLMRATGEESFETTAGGGPITERPDPGEVVWCDDAGVTCRRWNWRQTTRTRLRADTTAALFILDALWPVTDEALHAAADDLVRHLVATTPDLSTARRLMGRQPRVVG